MSGKIITAGLVLVVIALGYAFSRRAWQQYQLRQGIAALTNERERITSKNRELQDVITYLSSPGFVEQEARLRMDLKKPGEQVLVIDDSQKTTATATAMPIFSVPGYEKAVPPAPRTNPQKWRDYFFSKP
jgi:cell division protein FtsB